MSFSSHRSSVDAKKLEKKRSPPRASAEVIHKFDSNLREFSVRRSPLGAAKRAQRQGAATANDSTTAKQQRGGSSAADNRARKQSPQIISVTSSSNPKATTTSFGCSDGGGGGGDSSFMLPAKPRSVSPSSQRAKQTAVASAAPSSADGFDLLFAEFAPKKMSPSKFKSPFRGKGRSSSPAAVTPFYAPGDVDEKWIAVHARIVETQFVEKTIRRRMEALELQQLKLIWKYKNELDPQRKSTTV